MNSENPAQKVHLVVQSKGGVGKTFISTLLCQHLCQRSAKVLLIDTDPLNVSSSSSRVLERFTSDQLQVQKLRLSERKSATIGDFQQLADLTKFAEPGTELVIDVGTSIYDQLLKWLLSRGMGALQLSEDLGAKLMLHVPLAGGAEFTDTLATLSKLRAEPDLQNAHFTVWLNNSLRGRVFTGADTPQRHDIVPSERMSVIDLPDEEDIDLSTFGVALLKMNRAGLCFFS